MSYILDALKKSEYVRQQGRVPDLATLPVGEPLADPALSGARAPLLVGGALLLAFALAGWWRPWQEPHAAANPVAAAPADDPQPIRSVAPATALPPAASAVAPPAADTPDIGTPREAPTSTATPAVVAQPEPATPAPPLAVMQPLPAAQPKALPSLPQAAALPPPAVAPVAAAPAPATAQTDTALPAPPKRVLAFYELPEVVRARIPPLRVSGFSYAERPDLSLAVINDKVLRQGESAAPGITLERVLSDGVVLGFAGYRFRPQR